MVARAAPPAPIFKVKIKSGSRIIFITDPIIVPTIEEVAKPSVRIKLLGVNETIIKVEPRAIYL